MANTPIADVLITVGGHTIDISTQLTPGGQIEVVETVDGVQTLDLILCFLEGTSIATASGSVKVESLNRGDMVMTADGVEAPVRWVGRRQVSKTFADPMQAAPIRVSAGALGENLPARDLFVSPGHALFIDGVLVQASALVNGTSIVRETNMPESYTYYHVELANHALVLAEGVAAETFIDNASRMNFDNWAEHEALVDVAPIAEMAYPRAQSARQVPVAILQKIASRSVRQFGVEAVAA